MCHAQAVLPTILSPLLTLSHAYRSKSCCNCTPGSQPRQWRCGTHDATHGTWYAADTSLSSKSQPGMAAFPPRECQLLSCVGLTRCAPKMEELRNTAEATSRVKDESAKEVTLAMRLSHVVSRACPQPRFAILHLVSCPQPRLIIHHALASFVPDSAAAPSDRTSEGEAQRGLRGVGPGVWAWGGRPALAQGVLGLVAL